MKTLCPVQLDLNEATINSFSAWERGLTTFFKETSLLSRDWSTQLVALQSTMMPGTFTKVDALRAQLQPNERENMSSILHLVQGLVEGGKSLWVYKHDFFHMSQGPSDTARQFYSKVVEKATDCAFDKGYCDQCKQRAINDQIIAKLVFCCHSEEAKRQMLEKDDLSVEQARQFLERQEALEKTQQSLQQVMPATPHVSGMQRRHFGRRPPNTPSCPNCGGLQHKSRDDCPAKHSKCRSCGRIGHWSKVCRSSSGQDVPQQAGGARPKTLGHIVCAMTTTTEHVAVICEGRIHHAIIDTGSDWTCTSPAKLVSDFQEVLPNLLEPTTAMRQTKNASGTTMLPLGYFTTTFEFGAVKVSQNLVVYEDLDDTYLSKDALVRLGIVTINTTPPVALSADRGRSRPIPDINPAVHGNVDATISTMTRKKDNPPIPLPIPPSVRPGDALVRDPPPIPPRRGMPFSIKGRPVPLDSITRNDLLEEFHDVFAPRSSPIPGEEFQIVLRPDAKPTRVYSARSVPFSLEDKLRAELDKLEKEDIIEKVSHPTDWCHGLVVIPKDSDDVRPCVDFRSLNKFVVREAFDQLPVIEVVQQVQADQARYFSSADATGSYNQCPLSPGSRDLTTFITKFGRYRYKRAPYGIASISDHFNRRMTELLQGLPSLARVVDDTLIYGKTEEEHCISVIKFLQRCRDCGIRLNQKKFRFKQKEIVFAGLKLSEEGFTIAPKINEAIQEFPAPTTLTEVRSFFGLANQLAPYDHVLTQKLEPLRHLLKSKSAKIELSEDEKSAFKEVKTRLGSSETLAYYRPGRPVRLFTDAACTRGFGFVLQQLQPDNKWKPIMVKSRSLTSAETRYAPIEAEIEALTWALRKARRFLVGVPRFTVYTDHRPLVSLINSKRFDEVHNTVIVRNMVKCQEFNMQVEYIKGSENVAADSLSRSPVMQPKPADLAESEATSHHIKAIQMACVQEADMSIPEQEILEVGNVDAEYTLLRDQIRQGFPTTKRDLEPSLEPYWQVRHDLHVADDNLVLFGTRLVIPRPLRHRTLQNLHTGHRGIVGVKARARLAVYWPQVDNQIEQICKSCTQCQQDRPTQPKEPEIHFPMPERCFQYVSADLADVDGQKYLIVTDWKSGWFSTHQLRDATAQSIIHELRRQFMDTAVPMILFTDNGPPFISAEVKSFCARWGIRLLTSSPYYAQSNTFAENGVKNAKSLLRKCMRNGELDHDEWARGLLAIRNTPHHTSGLSPAVILYGHQVKEILPAHKSALSKQWHKQLSEFDRQVAQERQKADQYRPGQPLPHLKVGDPVLLQNRSTKRWDRFGVVQERNVRIRKYAIRLASGLVTVRNRHDLRLRHPPPDVAPAGAKNWIPHYSNEFEDDVEMLAPVSPHGSVSGTTTVDTAGAPSGECASPVNVALEQLNMSDSNRSGPSPPPEPPVDTGRPQRRRWRPLRYDEYSTDWN